VRDRSAVMAHRDDLYSIGATHPDFGALNGGEWIQLIDGHARRHADQIREICEESREAGYNTSIQSPYE